MPGKSPSPSLKELDENEAELAPPSTAGHDSNAHWRFRQAKMEDADDAPSVEKATDSNEQSEWSDDSESDESTLSPKGSIDLNDSPQLRRSQAAKITEHDTAPRYITLEPHATELADLFPDGDEYQCKINLSDSEDDEISQSSKDVQNDGEAHPPRPSGRVGADTWNIRRSRKVDHAFNSGTRLLELFTQEQVHGGIFRWTHRCRPTFDSGQELEELYTNQIITEADRDGLQTIINMAVHRKTLGNEVRSDKILLGPLKSKQDSPLPSERSRTFMFVSMPYFRLMDKRALVDGKQDVSFKSLLEVQKYESTVTKDSEQTALDSGRVPRDLSFYVGQFSALLLSTNHLITAAGVTREALVKRNICQNNESNSMVRYIHVHYNQDCQWFFPISEAQTWLQFVAQFLHAFYQVRRQSGQVSSNDVVIFGDIHWLSHGGKAIRSQDWEPMLREQQLETLRLDLHGMHPLPGLITNPNASLSPPTYIKIHSKYLSVESLKFFDIPWIYDKLDPSFYILLKEMTTSETDAMFDHTRQVRAEASKNNMAPVGFPKSMESRPLQASSSKNEQARGVAVSNGDRAKHIADTAQSQGRPRDETSAGENRKIGDTSVDLHSTNRAATGGISTRPTARSRNTGDKNLQNPHLAEVFTWPCEERLRKKLGVEGTQFAHAQNKQQSALKILDFVEEKLSRSTDRSKRSAYLKGQNYIPGALDDTALIGQGEALRQKMKMGENLLAFFVPRELDHPVIAKFWGAMNILIKGFAQIRGAQTGGKLWPLSTQDTNIISLLSKLDSICKTTMTLNSELDPRLCKQPTLENPQNFVSAFMHLIMGLAHSQRDSPNAHLCSTAHLEEAHSEIRYGWENTIISLNGDLSLINKLGCSSEDVLARVIWNLLDDVKDGGHNLPNAYEAYKDTYQRFKSEARESHYHRRCLPKLDMLEAELCAVRTVLTQQLSFIERLDQKLLLFPKFVGAYKDMIAEVEEWCAGLASLRTTILQLMAADKDRQDRSIFAFTVVTIVFLPLSFVTSFMGMNTADIRDTGLHQWIFWVAAIPLLFVVIMFSVWWAEGLEEMIDSYKKRARRAKNKLKTVLVEDDESISSATDVMHNLVLAGLRSRNSKIVRKTESRRSREDFGDAV